MTYLAKLARLACTVLLMFGLGACSKAPVNKAAQAGTVNSPPPGKTIRLRQSGVTVYLPDTDDKDSDGEAANDDETALKNAPTAPSTNGKENGELPGSKPGEPQPVQ